MKKEIQNIEIDSNGVEIVVDPEKLEESARQPKRDYKFAELLEYFWNSDETEAAVEND